MKTCILYFSASGNTKKFAQAISTSLDLPIFNVEEVESQIVNDYDIIIIGTPVHGMLPAKGLSSFVQKLPVIEDKKAIIFSTFAIRKGGATKNLEKQLDEKGFTTILDTSKRGIRFGEDVFEDNIAEIQKILQSCSKT